MRTDGLLIVCLHICLSFSLGVKGITVIGVCGIPDHRYVFLS